MKILKLNIGSHITNDEYLSDEFIIGIKKDENSNIIIDKDCYRRLDDKLERIYTDEELLKKGFTKVELDSKYADCEASDFNDNLTFSIEKYNARKQKETSIKYEDLIVKKIRKKYTINQELAILRQKDTKLDEYYEYFDYVEQCKEEAKNEYLRN